MDLGEDLLNEYVAELIREANEKTAPMVRIHVVDQYGDYRYVHFRVQIYVGAPSPRRSPWRDKVVFGGETRFNDAIATAVAMAEMYERGREEIKQGIRDKLGL